MQTSAVDSKSDFITVWRAMTNAESWDYDVWITETKLLYVVTYDPSAARSIRQY